jgi:gluconolactonase
LLLVRSLIAIVSVVLWLTGCKALEPDAGLRNVVSPHAPVDLVKEGFVLAEGPLPLPDGGLLFSDVRASRIYRLDLNGDITVFRDTTGMANGLAYSPRGELLAAEAGAKRISVTGRDGAVRDLTRGDGQTPLAAVNDLIADTRGGVYFTDPGPRPVVPGRKAYVYYLPPGSKIARVVDDTLVRPNGLTLTLDGRTLLVDDTVGHVVFAFDVRADGRLANKRPFARLRDLKEGQDSGADGMAIDREGRIFVTTVTGVQMFDPAGVYLGTIPVPRKATNVAFSGPGKGMLYITAREGLYRVRMLTRGPVRAGK